ncbi:MAG: hypothetical protein CVV56_08030 [Tenericutes bacterium HGW-Tenericutes-1]|nr:MAG: hypothetical protein CVV56_08030 [Tenericutes bacterium HGW-Tenericutes-1]PKM95793.1 MAG: hypothetical protein CVU84_03060 [Firmicutes bacterium HGW-Firmicutes-1]
MARHMTNEKIEKLGEYLKKYTTIKRMIKHDEKLLEDYYGLTGVNYDKVIVNPTNKFHSDTENQTISKIDIENRLFNNKKQLKRIDLALDILDDEARRIIVDYYIHDLGWIVIARKVGTSDRNCRRIRDEAMIQIHEAFYAERLDMKTGHAQIALDAVMV